METQRERDHLILRADCMKERAIEESKTLAYQNFFEFQGPKSDSS
jgi:hypothetical protein